MRKNILQPANTICVAEQIKKYLCDNIYMLCLALTAIGSYGFLVTHFSVSVDDLKYHYYYYGGLFAQGRYTGSLIERLFDLTDNIVWIQDFVGIVFLCFASILLCVLFDSHVKTKNHISQILFSCLLISYPLHSTLFAYGGCSMAIGVGLTFTGSALLLIQDYLSSRKKLRLALAVVLLILVVSWYESLMVLYVQLVFAILLLEQINAEKIKFSKFFSTGFFYAVPAIIAFAAELIITKLLNLAWKIPVGDYHANTVLSLDFSDKTELLNQLNYIIFGNYLRTAIQALFYPPMIIFGIALILLGIVGLIHSIRKKSTALFLTYFGITAVNFVLPLFMGQVAYRTCQSFAFLVAFGAFLLNNYFAKGTRKPQKYFSKVILVGLSCLIFFQTTQINGIFTTDDMRYQQERNTVEQVGTYLLENNLDSKPLVFAGEIDFSESVKSRSCVSKDNALYQLLLKVPWLGEYCKGLSKNRTDNYAFALQSDICISYINCALMTGDFGNCDAALDLFFRYCGFDTIKTGSKAQFEDAKKYVNELPAWPRQGSVKDMGDYVLVNLGESTVDTLS